MSDDKGTESVGGGWYIVNEAECADDVANGNCDLSDLELLFDASDDSECDAEFIDNDEVDEGNPTAFHNELLLKDSDTHLQDLKRKYISPLSKCVNELSPRLQSVSLCSQHKSKRRLFDEVVEKKNEAQSTPETSSEVSTCGLLNAVDITVELLRSKNRKVTALAKFKAYFGVSFSDLTRTFINDKTCSSNWVAAVFGVMDDLVESSKILLEQQCVFLQQLVAYTEIGIIVLFLFEFKSGKSRETVSNLLCSILRVENFQLMLEPPKIRSVVAALYFYKKGMGENAYMFGKYPEWVVKQTQVSHLSASETFELSSMVQWAYDNDFTEEDDIAYNYALRAAEDSNAAAWLRSNSQAKHVKDCAAMVLLYKKHELKSMSMSEYIAKRCQKAEGGGNWKVIMQLLKYQEVNAVIFLTALRDLLSGRPKKHCLVIYGPSDTGKSYFLYSLIRFLNGKVITFVNSRSHFWLQPLAAAKIALLDDATDACWQYFDTFMRTALDGNPVSVDCKFKAPTQLTLPPLLISTNVPVPTVEKYKYLNSRVMCFQFAKPCLFDDSDTPLFNLTNATWKSFFERLAPQLGLDLNIEEDGENSNSFRCVPGESAEAD